MKRIAKIVNKVDYAIFCVVLLAYVVITAVMMMNIFSKE